MKLGVFGAALALATSTSATAVPVRLPNPPAQHYHAPHYAPSTFCNFCFSPTLPAPTANLDDNYVEGYDGYGGVYGRDGHEIHHGAHGKDNRGGAHGQGKDH